MKNKLIILLLSVLGFVGSGILYSQTKGFDDTGMDKSIKPGDDFNLYINGSWLKYTEIPSDQSRWGSFVTLREDNNKNLRLIMEEAAAKKPASSEAEQKIGDFYASAMDTLNIEGLDFRPIQLYLNRIELIKDQKSLQRELAFMHVVGMNPLYTFFAYQDDKNSANVVAQFNQARLTLPEKGYYLDNDANKIKIRAAYSDYITNLFVFCGKKESDAREIAKTIIELETRLAKASKSAIDLRDPEANYNKLTKSQFAAITPNIDWPLTQKSLLIEEDTVLVGQPDYYKELNKVLVDVPMEVLKNYIKFQYISGFAPYLSTRFQKEAFNFAKEFSGQKQQQERAKRMVELVNGKLGELVGQVYVQRHFSPEAKTRMLELVKNLQSAYEARIRSASWMASETKEKAIKKLNGMILKIGYPDKWKDYSNLLINRKNFVDNIVSANIFEYTEMVKKLQGPVDKAEWLMTPAVVNAYYNPQTNEIAFPAGILQPPFFNMQADDAINYGAIGAVIGHEMTHGFDDQGRLYDINGNLGDWWTANDAKSYKERADKIVEQYNAYTVYDTIHVKGELTLGENIADNGGMAIAYDAFKNTPQGKSNDMIDGFTPDQRFFLGFGQIWRAKATQKFTLTMVNTNSHSPEQFRIKGTVSNFTPWYKAFNVEEGSKMYRTPKDRTQIW